MPSSISLVIILFVRSAFSQKASRVVHDPAFKTFNEDDRALNTIMEVINTFEEKNDQKQKSQMDSACFVAGWNLNFTLFCAMAFGKGVDTAVTGYSSGTSG